MFNHRLFGGLTMDRRCIFLTPYDQDILDPSGKARAFLRGLKKSSPTPVPTIFNHIKRDDWLNQWSELRAKAIAALPPSINTWLEATKAKYGPQGARFDLVELKQAYARSYGHASTRKSYHVALIGRDYLLRYVRWTAQRFGFPQFDYAYRGIVGTSAALPTMLDKGDYYAETLTLPFWSHPIPMLPGERNQRGKHRCINQDAVFNVRRIEGVLNSVRKWLVKYTPWFTSWENPTYRLAPLITEAILKSSVSIETDFKACDEHFSFESVSNVVLPVYEYLVPDQFVGFASFVEDLFDQPIYFGDRVWTGRHNLLSGQCITNDFETIYDVCVCIGAALVNGIEDYLLLCNGDDIAFVMPYHYRNKSKVVHDTLVDEFQRNGMEMSLDKSSIRVGEVSFCRKYYAPGVGPMLYNKDGLPYLLGVYPDYLTLNSIINPERRSIGAESTVATLQRCDNLYGSPLFTPFVQFLWSRAKGELFVDDLDEVASSLPLDWWTRLYGEIWTSQKSPTLSVMRQSNLRLVK
nr:RNA-dependent RNA polymerase [Picobirnavirus sp.]